jgi:hypothetical protein
LLLFNQDLRSERFLIKGDKVTHPRQQKPLRAQNLGLFRKINCLRDKHIEKYRIFAAF